MDALGLSGFQRFAPLFQRFAPQYDLDWVKLAALAFEESGLDHGRVSDAGAVALMQVLPSTAAYLSFQNPRDLEQNVNAGFTYIALLREHLRRQGNPAPMPIRHLLQVRVSVAPSAGDPLH